MRNLCASYARIIWRCWVQLIRWRFVDFESGAKAPESINLMRILVTPFYNRSQKMKKKHIKPKEYNEKVLQKQSLRATQKEMKSIQKVSKKDLNIEISKENMLIII